MDNVEFASRAEQLRGSGKLRGSGRELNLRSR
ncbi:hypothetical protein DFR71_3615 [Nocardia alba]|uniref:Uncharacterized protein n=1 Tax=Nocardia alba TaxID=225051 RepID=A0A4R1G1K9_9NOCA|nr:hypothetical protein DFR71_3615 [Nocardia alba]